ncbi:hypothetical protein EGR_11226 [Echinococcus granulosus]|uniref:Secreted protein n=1 Tax=Echinococcus granulosus TaxID=6210 RepID=W6U6D6_ECHGR|nr:hypothetical protein EGR_11226 [Echinococcus granulosus]EUB53917.1 hypothetical protein EGR_11226 [Echinococcus granulosus]
MYLAGWAKLGWAGLNCVWSGSAVVEAILVASGVNQQPTGGSFERMCKRPCDVSSTLLSRQKLHRLRCGIIATTRRLSPYSPLIGGLPCVCVCFISFDEIS